MFLNYGKIDYIGYSGGNHCDRLKKLPQVSSNLIYYPYIFSYVSRATLLAFPGYFFTYVQKILGGKLKKSQITR